MLYLLAGGSSSYALSIPKAPPLERPIIDQTKTLSEDEIGALSAQIATSRAEKSYQIAVLMIPTLGTDEYLEGYSLKVAREWGIGRSNTDNGVLLFIAKDDRKLRIEVGRGLEGDLTDVKASRIIRNVITPKFREGKFYEGIAAGIQSIHLAVAAKADPSLDAKQTSSSGSFLELMQTVLFFGIFGFIWLGSMLARSKSWWAGGVIGGATGVGAIAVTHIHPLAVIATVILIPLGLLFDFVVSRNYHQHKDHGTLPSWWAGGGSFGGGFGGGSGGGSFGGGGFSGGGSSGSW
jgi:uncharacterized protein